MGNEQTQESIYCVICGKTPESKARVYHPRGLGLMCDKCYTVEHTELRAFRLVE